MNKPIQLHNEIDPNRRKFIENDPEVTLDLISSICGKFIGGGCFRNVFEYNPDPDFVVKIEHGTGRANIVEHQIWEEVSGLCGNLAFVKKWFAPVKWISPSGRILVMQRTEILEGKKKPEKVPTFLWDIKPDNFGWIGNKYVCHDYGFFHALTNYSKRMKKANWE